MIALFFLVSRIVVLLTAIPIGKLIILFGYQKSLVIGAALQLLTFIALYYSDTQPFFVFPAMILEAVQLNFFWNSFHVVLSKSMLRHRLGQDLSTIQFLLQLIAVITPAVSGVIAVAFGLESLFLFGIVGTLISMLFAMGLEIGHERDTLSLLELRNWLKEPSYRNVSISLLAGISTM